MNDDDQNLSERIATVVRQRDEFRALASEMLATLTLTRNAPFVSVELAMFCKNLWTPAFESAVSGTELTDEQIGYALASHAIDVEAGNQKLQAAIEKYNAKHEPSDLAAEAPNCPRHPDTKMIYADGMEHYHDIKQPHWRCELWIGSGVCGATREIANPTSCEK